MLLKEEEEKPAVQLQAWVELGYLDKKTAEPFLGVLDSICLLIHLLQAS